MRFTKAIREYVDEQLTAKRLEANNNDIDKIEYNARREEVVYEIKQLVEGLRHYVDEIMTENGFENTNSRYANIISFNDVYIGNLDMIDKFRKREQDRYDKQKKIMREIEVNCTLGADREEFMQMLSEVEF